jgi:hypothetical protein
MDISNDRLYWDTYVCDSPLGVICSILYGIIVISVLLAIGYGKCAPGMPLSPSNSLLIAAARYPLKSDHYAARKTVVPTRRDGEEQSSVQHYTITNRRVEDHIEGRWCA